ncbi:MAG: dTDP-4-dehydrorhamnose reductase [Hyphomicrobiaceae bacterium]
MRLLVAGASGQLAHALVGRARGLAGVGIVALEPPQLDLLDPASITRALASTRPDVVINAAAYTAVDKAENDAAAAFALNRDGPGDLAAAAEAAGCPIIHVSTDYVFDGTKSGAYVEQDTPNPMCIYGRSKLEGESAVAVANARHVILRTAWLYGAHGHNFLKTMLRLARERPELRVVADQSGNPTYAPHLADVILAIAAKIGSGQPWGVYHATAAGETTWHGFASAIIAAAKPLGVPQVPILPITTTDYPTPARRPANSCLDCSKLERAFGLRLPPWQQGLAECFGELA